MFKFKSSHRWCSVKKVFLKNFGKHLCWSLFLIKLKVFTSATLLERYSNTGISCEICEIFQNTYFEEYLRTTTSVVSFSWHLCWSLFIISLQGQVRNAGARCAGFRCQVRSFQVSGARFQASGATFKIPEICKILKLLELILNNPSTNIYVGNLQYPSLQINIFLAFRRYYLKNFPTQSTMVAQTFVQTGSPLDFFQFLQA